MTITEFLNSKMQSSKSLLCRYKFSVRNPFERSPSWSPLKSGDEFDFLFGRPLATINNQGSLSTEKDVALSRFVIQSWSNFVKTGWAALQISLLPQSLEHDKAVSLYSCLWLGCFSVHMLFHFCFDALLTRDMCWTPWARDNQVTCECEYVG